MIPIYWRTVATFLDGTVSEEDWTNPVFETVAEVEAYCKEEFGTELKSLKISKIQDGEVLFTTTKSY